MFILVTGCAGFIGSHLCEALLAGGHDVSGVDALTDYYDPQRKLRNLSRALDCTRFRFLHTRVSQTSDDVLREAEVIYHLAAQPGVRTSWGTGFETYVQENILSTQALLEHVRDSKNLKRFIYASSSSVYGNTAAEKVSEECATNPVSPYGVTKLAAEHLVSSYADSYGFPATSLRLFTVCGPRQRPDMMFHKLIRAALTGTSFTLYGDGGMERDFTSVFDVRDVLVQLSSHPAEERVFNVANGKVVSIREAIALVEELCGVKIAIEYREERRGDVQRTSADISRAESLLQYRPKRDLRNTISLQICDMEGAL